MTEEHKPFDAERCSEELPESALERSLIREYLREKGYSLEDLHKLPPELAKSLMREACQFAALKLAEVESRAKFQREIHTTL